MIKLNKSPNFNKSKLIILKLIHKLTFLQIIIIKTKELLHPVLWRIISENKNSIVKHLQLQNNGLINQLYTLHKDKSKCSKKDQFKFNKKDPNLDKNLWKENNRFKVSEKWSKCFDNNKNKIYSMTYNLSVYKEKDYIKLNKDNKKIKRFLFMKKISQKLICKGVWSSAINMNK